MSSADRTSVPSPSWAYDWALALKSAQSVDAPDSSDIAPGGVGSELSLSVLLLVLPLHEPTQISRYFTRQ